MTRITEDDVDRWVRTSLRVGSEFSAQFARRPFAIRAYQVIAGGECPESIDGVGRRYSLRSSNSELAVLLASVAAKQDAWLLWEDVMRRFGETEDGEVAVSDGVLGVEPIAVPAEHAVRRITAASAGYVLNAFVLDARPMGPSWQAGALVDEDSFSTWFRHVQMVVVGAFDGEGYVAASIDGSAC